MLPRAPTLLQRGHPEKCGTVGQVKIADPEGQGFTYSQPGPAQERKQERITGRATPPAVLGGANERPVFLRRERPAGRQRGRFRPCGFGLARAFRHWLTAAFLPLLPKRGNCSPAGLSIPRQ